MNPSVEPGGRQREGGTEPEGLPPPRERVPSIPVIDVVLDPRGPGEPPRKRSVFGGASPERTAIYGIVGGLSLFGCIFAALIRFGPPRSLPQAQQALEPSAEMAVPETSSEPPPRPTAPPPPPIQFGPAIPGPWRLAQLSSQPDVKIVEGAMDRRSLVDALAASGVPKGQIYRILAAFKGVHTFDKSRKKDTFAAALELPSRRVRAFEYLVGPTEIYQAKERDGGELAGDKLDLHVEKRQVSAAVVVGDDLAKSLTAVGLDPSLMDILDDALEGRAQLSSLHLGARLRLVVEVETALGAFARYTNLVALEYIAEDGDTPPLRIYHFQGTRSEGYFDARARQPYKGGFRTPIPFARISSRFNMHRMHPILHVIKPHNGVDFAAPSGTPVYAAGFGNVQFAGDGGPSGNLVTIRHPDGLTTGYAHLLRFAPHLKTGQAVETRQLIGYVGSTGRSTGSHLHFSAKKNGVFIDPLRLKLDGERVLPKSERDEFDDRRAALDKLLDAVVLPGPIEVARGHAEGLQGEPLEPADDER